MEHRRPARLAALLLLSVVLAASTALAETIPAPSAPADASQFRQNRAPQRGEDEDFVRSPNDAPLPPLPPPQEGLLERSFPVLRDGLGRLPPFFRDMDLNTRLRSFYFNRQNPDETANEAWALGGWVDLTSGWLLDTFALGATYYTSFPAYAPDDLSGSLLLTPSQGAIDVFGQAWAAFRWEQYALLKGYRQRIDDGYVNPQDNRMVPNTFEAGTLSGKVDWFQYDLGYVSAIKPRDSNEFVSMSERAGAPGDKGLILSSFTFTPTANLFVYTGNFFALDVFNTAFAKSEYTLAVRDEVKLQLGLQFTDQRSVGEERAGDFSTWNVGAGGRLLWRGLSVGTAMHFTDDEAPISSPWGTWPGYLSMIVTDFDRADEKAFGFGVRYNFAGTLLPFQIPGLTLYLAYAQGTDRIDPETGLGLPTTREGDLDVIYAVPGVPGLSLRFRNGYVDRGDPSVLQDFRIIVNYELDLL